MSTKITFIGAGNMASSLVGGMIAKGINPTDITLTDIHDEPLQAARRKHQVNTTRDSKAACEKADVVVLAVKPQVMESALGALQAIFQQQKPLIISIAAGVTLEQLDRWSGQGLPIVRCMPNTPALVQCGATGLYANPKVDERQKELAKSILNSVGLALWLNTENEIDIVTAVSGSGPAYFFLVMEAMMSAGKDLGLTDSVAKQLTLQTALGAAQMAITSDTEVAELRRRVTSPGGTTEQAIGILEQEGLREAFQKALKGAYDRSKELAGQ